MTRQYHFEHVIARVLTLLVLALCVAYTLFWFLMAVQKVLYPYQLDYGEGPLLHQALTLAQGGQIYTDLSTAPYTVANYPPVFVTLWAILTRFAGPVFWPGRLIAVVSTLAIAFCIYHIIRHFTSDRWAGLLAVGCFLWLRPVRAWTALARADMLAIALAIGGLVVITMARPRSRWLAVPLFVLAFFTKQTMVAAPAAAYLYLWLKGERKQAGTLFLAHVAAIALIFALLQWWTNGHFWANVVTANQNEWLWSVARYFIRKALSDWPVVLGLALAGMFAWLGDRRVRGLALYFLISTLVAMTIGKVGSWWNYAIEATAAGMILLGLVWAVARPSLRLPRLGNARTLIACLMLFQLAALWWRPVLGADPAYHNRTADARLEQIVVSETGEVLSENMGVLAKNDRKVWLQPLVTTQISKADVWDQSGVLEMLRNKFFSLIILSGLPNQLRSEDTNEMWTKKELQAMAENYQFWQNVGPWYLLRPKGCT